MFFQFSIPHSTQQLRNTVSPPLFRSATPTLDTFNFLCVLVSCVFEPVTSLKPHMLSMNSQNWCLLFNTIKLCQQPALSRCRVQNQSRRKRVIFLLVLSLFVLEFHYIWIQNTLQLFIQIFV